ncbi:alpha amylase N-terminal ig-like domain-containing protein [Metabacillus litoralis]|uniref:alpha amylase N-terminal ig-like domain-containing protein n=1 Tax=Metabacillus litoralis TaxID=152268 RepID=UPI001CFEE592|nr:alpha amylase N-terminal ig-like domain-containing protein [Metabacillus litoralis]
MLKEAIYHRPKNQFAYSLHDGTIQIQLRTKHNDVDSIYIYYGDPFHFTEHKWINSSVQMKISGRDELFDYWIASLQPPQNRLRYAFELIQNEQSLFLLKRDFVKRNTMTIPHIFVFLFIILQIAFMHQIG